jgi:zinc transport system substrate-binding protein
MSLKRNVLLLLILLIPTAVVSPPAARAQVRTAGRIRILATIFPLMEFASAVAGDRGEAALLLPPGAEIHTWQPRVSDIRKLGVLDMFLFIGPSLEPWAPEILRTAGGPRLRVFEADRALRQAGGPGVGAGETLDPHLWLDFGLDLDLVDRIAAVLTEIDPSGRAGFETRAEAYKDKLRRLDAEYRDAFRSCEEKTFVFGGHAAFGYLARRYGLVQIPVYGLSPDAAPTPKALAEIIARARTMRIRTVFFEENVSDKMARLIAREIGADVRVLNPGHNLTPEQFSARVTFLDLMRQNLEGFKHGLGCR